MTRVTLATAGASGAVAVLQLHGEGLADTLRQLTGRGHWPERHAMLCSFAGIDEGLAVLIRGDDVDHPSPRGRGGQALVQLMPHGGPRVVQRLIEHLTAELGCAYDPEPDTRAMYPEAGSPIEADMLDAIARAASPAAIDLLAAQPEIWRRVRQQAEPNKQRRQAIAVRSRVLDRLITPPTVVVVGPPNAGKSTLTNALMGRAVSIVADLPGTTRDWVGGLVELGPSGQAVAVHWLDTPGLRASSDAVEQRAITLASQQIERADVLIALRGFDQDWPEEASRPRVPDLWVVNKIDDAGPPNEGDGLSLHTPLLISAEHGHNLAPLNARVLESLRLVEIIDEPWAFTDTLRRGLEPGSGAALERYCGHESEHGA